MFMVKEKVEDRPRTRTRGGVEFGVEVEGDGYDVPVFQVWCIDYLNNTIPIPTRSDQPVEAECQFSSSNQSAYENLSRKRDWRLRWTDLSTISYSKSLHTQTNP
jgi:hypothetical protein